MFNRLKEKSVQYLLSLYIKFRYKEEVVDMKKSFVSSKKILVLLPSARGDFEIALSYLKKIKEIFKERDIIYVLPQTFHTLFTKSFTGNPFYYQEKDITYFSLPSRKIINSLRKEHFDITTSMNPDFDLFSAYTCLKSEAKLRIGLYDEKAERYYNFQVKKDGDKLLGERYKCLMKYLDMMVYS